ncbi:c-type cytochrome [Winogradskyella sp. PE311]|uniref:c-type cytochrome n=1 Tax=Winogradskyella sp. PE311 TaxID=3366943 RepID=UPI0039817F70
MKKIVKLVVLLLIVVSCNSNEKEDKTNKVKYPKKTSIKQVSPELKASIIEGKLVYENLCITCHMADGKGVTKAFPPLANSDYLKKKQTASIKAVKNGMSGEITVNGITYNSVMAPLGLSDEEVADVVNYINNSWGNNYGKMLTAEQVGKIAK